MLYIYNSVIFLYVLTIRLAALWGNSKAKKWVEGRRNWEIHLQESLRNVGQRKVWFHCASLGEFEQGRPLLEKLKQNDPDLFIVLTFFSPSGYEVRKNYSYAGLVCYLPSDSLSNAKKFLALVKPDFIVFVKYEFWYHYIAEAAKQKIPLYIASAIFRPTQLFFKWYGVFFLSMLKKISFFFVQDEESASLLHQSGIVNYEITGDTRFDRVAAIAQKKSGIDLLDRICVGKDVIVAGSTWPEDESILLNSLPESRENLLIIIAPHEVNERRIQDILKQCESKFKAENISLYSSPGQTGQTRVLILDTIGLLSTIYKYATVAFIGGGFGKGIHNILEATAFGKPVIFGPHYKKFKEAVELISIGGAYSISDSREAKKNLEMLLYEKDKLAFASEKCLKYISSKTGATQKIISYLEANKTLHKKTDIALGKL